MGSTSFLGFSYPNLRRVFSEPVMFRNLYHIFFSQVLGLSLGLLFYFLYLILGWLVTTEIRFFVLKSKKEKGTG